MNDTTNQMKLAREAIIALGNAHIALKAVDDVDLKALTDRMNRRTGTDAADEKIQAFDAKGDGTGGVTREQSSYHEWATMGYRRILNGLRTTCDRLDAVADRTDAIGQLSELQHAVIAANERGAEAFDAHLKEAVERRRAIDAERAKLAPASLKARVEQLEAQVEALGGGKEADR